MDKNQQSSRRLLWIIVGAVVAVLVIISIVLYVVFGTAVPEEDATNNSGQTETSETSVPSADEAKQNLATLDASIEQSVNDQKAAQAAIDDSKNRVKLGD